MVYYNNFDLAHATTSKIIALKGEIPAQGYYLIADGAQTLCYQSVVASASLGFATGSGQVQLMRWEQAAGQPFGFTTVDAARWYRKTSASSPNPPDGVILFQNASQQPDEFAFRERDGQDDVWRVARSQNDDCSYEIEGEEKTIEDPAFAFLTGAMPPVRYVAAVSDGGGRPINRNVGKAAPIINEVLPNPASPQTDAEDEFIEIYNPNDSVFDLSGFKLAFGSSNPRKYTFPESTLLQPKEFKSFTSGDTSLSLSNTEAQVWLLDPNEQIISQSEPYQNAKDGQAWVLDGGKWTWTLQPTKDAMNAIAKSITSSEKEKTAAATLGISDTGSTSTGAPSAENDSSQAELDDAAPLHPGVLAVVGAGAVAYTLYEYRQDLSNRIFQFRRYLRRRQALRREV